MCFSPTTLSMTTLRCTELTQTFTSLLLSPDWFPDVFFYFYDKFLTVSLQTLLPSPEINRSLLTASNPKSSLNLRVFCKIIISSLSDTFFGVCLY